MSMKTKRCILRQHGWLMTAILGSTSIFQPVWAHPTNLVLRGSWPESAGGSAVALAVNGPRAYVANGTRGLAILDVSDPAQPVQVGRYQTPGCADAIVVLDHYVYLNASGGGTYVLDVADSTDPVLLGSVEGKSYFRAGQVAGDLLFLGTGNYTVFDVSDPACPILMTDLDIIGNAQDLKVDGNYAFLAAEVAGLSIYNVSDPFHPTYVTNCDLHFLSTWSIDVASGYAFVSEEMTLHVFDVHDPARPIRVSDLALNGVISDLDVVEDHLVVAHGDVSIFAVSSPASPVRLTGFKTPGFAQDLQVVGNYVFVADGNAGLVILECQPLQWPALSITGDSTNTIIRWPVSALGFRLESNADLSTSNWLPTLDPPQVTGERFSVSIPAQGSEYFRLHRP